MFYILEKMAEKNETTQKKCKLCTRDIPPGKQNIDIKIEIAHFRVHNPLMALKSFCIGLKENIKC